MRKFYALTCFLIRVYMKVVGNYQIIGKEKLKDWKPCIVAANHISLNDPPFIGAILGREVHYLAKKELFRNKFAAMFLRYFNSFPVKRATIDRDALKRIKELVQMGESILLFPEGSRKNYTAKPGIGYIVYITNVSVLPIKIENAHKLKDCLLRKRRVRIIIGDMIEMKPFLQLPAEKETYRLIADEVLNQISSLS